MPVNGEGWCEMGTREYDTLSKLAQNLRKNAEWWFSLAADRNPEKQNDLRNLQHWFNDSALEVEILNSGPTTDKIDGVLKVLSDLSSRCDSASENEPSAFYDFASNRVNGWIQKLRGEYGIGEWETQELTAEISDIGCFMGESDDSSSRQAARIDRWNEFQSGILPWLQKWFERGWEPATEVGPNCISLDVHLQDPRTMSWSQKRPKYIARATAFKVTVRRRKA